MLLNIFRLSLNKMYYNTVIIQLSVWSDFHLRKHNCRVCYATVRSPYLYYTLLEFSQCLSLQASAATRPHLGVEYGTQTPVSRPDALINMALGQDCWLDWWTNVTAIFGKKRINNIVEIWLFALPKVVQPQYTGEAGKFITLWCQISWGCGLPKIMG